MRRPSAGKRFGGVLLLAGVSFGLFDAALSAAELASAIACLTVPGTPNWVKTTDGKLEYPQPDGFDIIKGLKDTEDSILFKRMDGASVGITPGGAASMDTLSALAESISLAKDSTCREGVVHKGKLSNGWSAAWKTSRCGKPADRYFMAALIMRVAGTDYMVSSARVSPASLFKYAGLGRRVTAAAP